MKFEAKNGQRYEAKNGSCSLNFQPYKCSQGFKYLFATDN